MSKTCIAIALALCSASALANTQGVAVPIPLAAQKQFIGKINQCANPKAFDRFIEGALKNADDYQARAGYASVLEDVMKYNPACFVATVKKLAPAKCEQLQQAYIEETFFYPRDEIKGALSSTRDYGDTCLAG